MHDFHNGGRSARPGENSMKTRSKGLESTGYLGVVTREPWVDKFNMYTNKSLSRLERFESKLGSEFVCFFDF